MVVPGGIEPSLGANLARTGYKSVGASNYTTGPENGGPEGIRTPNQRIMSPLL